MPELTATNPDNLVPDWTALRAQFPFLKDCAFFDIGRKAPLPLCAKQAADTWFNDAFETGGLTSFSMEGKEATRFAVARAFGASPECIALVRNTSEGIGAIAAGFPFRPGDNVIISELEHENNTFQWLHARDLGLEVRYARPDEDGCVRPEAYHELIDARTRMIGVAWIAYGNGYRADLHAISEICKPFGIKIVVDAIQAVGVLDQRIDALGADAVVSGGHKAQFSVTGSGFMYLTPEMSELVRPPIAAKYSFESTDRRLPEPKLHKSARRFEYGNPNFMTLAIQKASAEFVSSIGLHHIEKRVRDLTTYLIAELEQRQFRLLTPAPWHERGGIVAFEIKGDADFLEAALQRKGIRIAAKDGHMRAAVHFYNTQHDIDRLVSAITEQ